MKWEVVLLPSVIRSLAFEQESGAEEELVVCILNTRDQCQLQVDKFSIPRCRMGEVCVNVQHHQSEFLVALLEL